MTRQVMVTARPQPISLDLAQTAILVIDMQNDFGATGGLFERGGVNITAIQQVVAPTRRVLDAGRAAGLPIVYLKMGFCPDLSDLGSENSPNRVRHLFFGVGKTVRSPTGQPGRLLVRDTWNTEILPELTPMPEDHVLWKHRFSGFFETELDKLLKHLAVEFLIITGCTTSVCVDSTVRDAMFRDYSCLLLEDCMAEPIGSGSCHEASLLALQTLFAWVASSTEFIRSLTAASVG